MKKTFNRKNNFLILGEGPADDINDSAGEKKRIKVLH